MLADKITKSLEQCMKVIVNAY